jgi:putative oxidoreductase
MQFLPGRAQMARLPDTGKAGSAEAATAFAEPAVNRTHRRRTRMPNLSAYTLQARAILRIMTALLFLEHGTQKFLSFPPGETAGFGWTFAHPGAYAGIIELLCGFLIAIGLFTRPAAFLASGTMAVAYFMSHAPQNFFPVNNQGDAAILYCFVFLYFVFAGPGAWALDNAMGKGRGAPDHAA